MGPGEKNLATRPKNLGFVLGNRKPFRKILRQPWRCSFEGAELEEPDSYRRPEENQKTKAIPQRACTHAPNLKGRSLDGFSPSPFSALQGHFRGKRPPPPPSGATGAYCYLLWGLPETARLLFSAGIRVPSHTLRG